MGKEQKRQAWQLVATLTEMPGSRLAAAHLKEPTLCLNASASPASHGILGVQGLTKTSNPPEGVHAVLEGVDQTRLRRNP